MRQLVLALTLLALPMSSALAISLLHPPLHHHRRLPHRLFYRSHPRPMHTPVHPMPLKH
jgi:hypothetical protein